MFALVFATLATPAQASDIHLDLNATMRLGDDVRIDAPVSGDVFAAGGTLVIDAPVKGDVNGVAEKVHITKRGRVDGTIRLVAEEMVIDGLVKGGLKGAAETLWLSSTIEGDSEFAVKTFHAERGAAFGGAVEYESPKVIPQLQTITAGKVEWTDKLWEDRDIDINFD